MEITNQNKGNNESSIADMMKVSTLLTLKGPLSVLKAMPGTYFNQTGNPLNLKQNKDKKTEIEYIYISMLNPKKIKISLFFLLNLIIYPKFHSAQI